MFAPKWLGRMLFLALCAVLLASTLVGCQSSRESAGGASSGGGGCCPGH